MVNIPPFTIHHSPFTIIMIHLLKLEWLKQKDYILFRILLVVYAVMLPALLMIGKKIKISGGELPFNPQISLFHFPTVWEWLAYIGNWLVFFVLGFMAVLIITNEHSFKTLRQNIITGLQRKNWFWSKALFILAISAAVTLYYALCSLAIGLYHAMGDTIYMSTVFKNADYILRFFLMCLGYMSFGMLIGVLVKRTGIALFVFLGYSFFLEPVIRWVVHLKLFKNASMNYYPMNVFEDLCPVPFSDQANRFASEYNFDLFLQPSVAIGLAVFYILLLNWFAYKRLTTSDL